MIDRTSQAISWFCSRRKCLRHFRSSYLPGLKLLTVFALSVSLLATSLRSSVLNAKQAEENSAQSGPCTLVSARLFVSFLYTIKKKKKERFISDTVKLVVHRKPDIKGNQKNLFSLQLNGQS